MLERELTRYNLDAVPTWGGLSAADGKLFVGLKNGSVICYRKERQ